MSWKAPTAAELMDVVNATWPAARQFPCGPFMLRDGQNGGKRASAATLEQADFSTQDIENAAQQMRALNQAPLFIIRENDQGLDAKLADLGYRSFDFVTLFAAPSKVLAQHDLNNLNAIPAPEPVAMMAEIWAKGGIAQARIDVMLRTPNPKTFFLGRINDTPAGAGFVAIHNNIAMIHALEVLETAQRQGLGLKLMTAAAVWACEQNAKTFALVVVSKNQAACGLYNKLGMTKSGNYHYRIKD